MKKPEVIEVYADNGHLSHYALVDTETNNKLWSEAPEECKAMGYPVVNNDCIHSVSESFSSKQSHKVRTLLKDFYMWMQENDYEHNIPQRVENKAELFLREKNVR